MTLISINHNLCAQSAGWSPQTIRGNVIIYIYIYIYPYAYKLSGIMGGIFPSGRILENFKTKTAGVIFANSIYDGAQVMNGKTCSLGLLKVSLIKLPHYIFSQIYIECMNQYKWCHFPGQSHRATNSVQQVIVQYIQYVKQNITADIPWNVPS